MRRKYASSVAMHTRPQWEHFCLVVLAVFTVFALSFELVSRSIPRKAYRTLHGNRYASRAWARDLERTADQGKRYCNLADQSCSGQR
jgi:hypothetical protein